MKNSFIVIGIADSPQPFFPPEVTDIIRRGRVFSGGRRHHEIVASLLPEGAEWIDITVPLDDVWNRYRSLNGETAEHAIIVFASGDPLFYGFAVTLRREFPDAEIQVFPTLNSLQMLAHRLAMPYHDMRVVSLTGRPWQELDRALIECAPKIGILTDREHTPDSIWRHMMEYGYTGYRLYVGERLGNPVKERVYSFAPNTVAAMPNCVIAVQTEKRSRRFGIPDNEFALLDGREKMITKMPIRLMTLQALDLPRRHVLWDIGACTGSVSIEARLMFPHLRVEAFEIRPECEAIINDNARRHGAPGIGVHIGDFKNIGCNTVATNGKPDAVFIGGHGGQLKDIMKKIVENLAPDGVIVMNSVTSAVVEQMTNHRPTSRQLWDEACTELGLHKEQPIRITLNDYNPIEILITKTGNGRTRKRTEKHGH